MSGLKDIDTNLVLAATSLFAYLVCTLLLSGRISDRIHRSRTFGGVSGGIAWLLHGWMLYSAILAAPGMILNTGSAFSFVGWMMAAMGLIFIAKPTFSGLAIILVGIGGVSVLATGLGGPGYSSPAMDWPLKAHILLSAGAYGLLSVAAALAVLLAIQDNRLRSRKPTGWLRRLPPMDAMEGMMFGAITIGFIGLTLAVFSGLIFVEDLFSQHLAHKTVLSLVSWLVFGVLTLGRWRFGWRGRIALLWVLGGFVILALAYFGSKIVLEVFLHRQWSVSLL